MTTKRLTREKKHTTRGRLIFFAWITIFALIVALTITLSNQTSAQAQQSSDENAVKGITLKAFGASVQAVVLPHTSVVFAKQSLSAASTDIAQAQISAESTFNSIFDASCVPCKTIINGTHASISGESGGRYRALGWGVKDQDWRQVLVNNQTASVTFAATLWSKVQFTDEFGKLHTVTPTQGLVKIYTLYKTNNRWLITNIVDDDIAASSLPVNQLKGNGQTGGPPKNEPSPAKGNGPVGTKPALTPTP